MSAGCRPFWWSLKQGLECHNKNICPYLTLGCDTVTIVSEATISSSH